MSSPFIGARSNPRVTPARIVQQKDTGGASLMPVRKVERHARHFPLYGRREVALPFNAFLACGQGNMIAPQSEMARCLSHNLKFRRRCPET